MATSCLRQSIAGAISIPQFLAQFRLAWTESRVSGLRGGLMPRRLGLAVSGGADSMALAYLCKQMERNGLVEGLSVTAFVVDHKAREESSKEASMVARWLGDMDITTKILELEWHSNSNSNNNHVPGTEETRKSKEKGKPLSAFETHARRLRFQALGTACRDNHIETLMMGHHQDDNVETTLWRLSTGARGVGLAGIPQVARIPECHGLYGVSDSGGESVILSGPGLEQEQEHRISTGGISICRPLLSFPKTHILATCHEHNIPFVNDPTNFDPTLTPRNAIRSLLSSNRLPRALAQPSILSLIKTSRTLIRNSVDLSNGVLGRCRLLEFNLTSGTMVVQFPSPSSAEAEAEATASIPTCQIQAMALRRITELISPFPENHFPLKSFEKFTDRLFPSSTLTPSPSEAKRQSFTLGGVMFQPLQQKSNRNNANNQDNTWFLSRQPFMRHRLPAVSLDIPIPPTSTPTFTSTSNPRHYHQPQPQEPTNYTPWVLWDDRYWIRCCTSSSPSKEDTPETESHLHSNNVVPATVTIRPLQQSDLHYLRHALSPHLGHQNQPMRKIKTDQSPVWCRLMEMLSQNAPNQSRFTIPVLEAVNSQGGGVQLLALPTTDFRFPSPPGSIPEIKWEWLYKMIDHETVKSMGWKICDGS